MAPSDHDVDSANQKPSADLGTVAEKNTDLESDSALQPKDSATKGSVEPTEKADKDGKQANDQPSKDSSKLDQANGGSEKVVDEAEKENKAANEGEPTEELKPATSSKGITAALASEPKETAADASVTGPATTAAATAAAAEPTATVAAAATSPPAPSPSTTAAASVISETEATKPKTAVEDAAHTKEPESLAAKVNPFTIAVSKPAPISPATATATTTAVDADTTTITAAAAAPVEKEIVPEPKRGKSSYLLFSMVSKDKVQAEFPEVSTEPKPTTIVAHSDQNYGEQQSNQI